MGEPLFKTIMIQKKLSKYLIFPGIYTKTFTNKNVKGTTLESITLLGNDDSEISKKEIIKGYFSSLIIMLWAAQTLTSSILTVDGRSPINSKEKVFQQTQSHGIFCKVMTQTQLGKTITAVVSVYQAIERGFYKIDEEELQDNDTMMTAITNDIVCARYNKGIGNLRKPVRDRESRLTWILGNSASIRSTWISCPVFSPSSLTKNYDIKKVYPQDVKNYFEEITASLLNEDVADYDIPTWEDFEIEFKESIKDLLNDDFVVDDSAFGTIPSCPLDSLVGIQRVNIPKKIINKSNSLLDKILGKPQSKATSANTTSDPIDDSIKEPKPKGAAKVKAKAKPKDKAISTEQVITFDEIDEANIA